MPTALSLTDSQLSAVLRAATPLLPDDRSAFLVALAQALRDERELGDGVVFRAIRSLQREFWQPPRIDNDDGRHGRRQVGEPIA